MLLEGADEVDWASLDRAYHSPDSDVPGTLRALASTDPAAAEEAFETISGWTVDQGAVYPTAVAVVPFLLEVAAVATHRRARVVEWVGELAKPEWGYPREVSDEIRAAVARHGDRLVALLGDPDPDVRVAAAYTASQVRDAKLAGALRRRWAVEHSAEVGRYVLIALAAQNPEGMADLLGRILLTGSASHRLAAAHAIHHAAVPWPAGSASALVGAVEAGAWLARPWTPFRDTLVRIIESDGDEEFVTEVARLALRSAHDGADEHPVWHSAIYGIEGRCKSRRGAAERLLPLLAPLLDSPDAERRDRAAAALHDCGRAAGRFADRLATIAGGLPEAMGEELRNAEFWATETLIRLGDPRGVAPAVAAWSSGPWLFRPDRRVFGPIRPALITEVGRHLDAAAARGDRRAVAALARFAEGLGHAAAPLGPALRSGRTLAEREVIGALIATGAPTDDELQWAVDSSGPRLPAPSGEGSGPRSPVRSVEAAVELFRRTGRPEPVRTVLDRCVAGGSDVGHVLAKVLPVADRLPPLGDILDALDGLTGAEGPSYAGILTAHVRVRNGGPAPSRDAMWDALTAGFEVAEAAAELAVDLPELDLDSALRLLLDDRWAWFAAAEALVARGAPPDEFGDAFIAWLRRDFRLAPDTVMRRCARFAATPTMLARLRGLVEADERLIQGGELGATVWQDEALLDTLRFAVTVLSDSTA